MNTKLERLRFLQGLRIHSTLPPVPIERKSIPSLQDTLRKNRVAVECFRLVTPHLKALAIRSLGAYLYHGPNFYLPPFKGRSVATIHDLSVYNWPDSHPPERVRYIKKEVALTLRRAAYLITDSEFTRMEVVNKFSWPPDKIRAVPLASAGGFHPRDPSECRKLLTRYGLTPGGYCLYAGTIEPRKNIEALLDAYAALPSQVRRQWPLVLTGYHGWRSDVIHKRIRAAEQDGWACYLGYVEDGHLPILFAGARLFAYPSLYEGFGLPVLEAMASGTPIVCSKSSSLPEVVGDAAAMCDPDDVNRLGHLLLSGLEDEKWRRVAIAKGLGRAAQFSWHRCANETIEAYQEALCT